MKTLLAIFTALSLACCADKQFSLEEYSGTFIEFGSGGGITGQEDRFLLLPDGRIFQYDLGANQYNQARRISRDEASSLFQSAEIIANNASDIDAPGNIYHFLRIHMPQQDQSVRAQHSYIYQPGDKSVSGGVRTLYHLLINAKD